MDKEISRIVNRAEESEKSIEKHLIKRVKELGGLCLKYSNPWLTGMPDRVCLLPYGRTIWVELKSKGAKREKIQAYRGRQLDDIGFKVYVCDSKFKVDDMLRDHGYEIPTT